MKLTQSLHIILQLLFIVHLVLIVSKYLIFSVFFDLYFYKTGFFNTIRFFNNKEKRQAKPVLKIFFVSYLIIVHTESGPQPAALPSSVSRCTSLS